MILLLGGSGYVGQAYQAYFKQRGLAYLNISRKEHNYYDTHALVALIKQTQARFLVNTAGYTGKPNVDACEYHKADCTLGNAVLPGLIKEACEIADIPWGHVSSGCIYSGRRPDGGGFKEDDAPNFSFRSNHCSFYSGTKALGEEVLADAKRCYIWRLRIPFDHVATPRNYLQKLIVYKRLLEAENSISHLGEFVDVSLKCWEQNIPYGIYNLTNPGAITTRSVVAQMQREGERRKAAGLPNPFPEQFDFFDDEGEFMQKAAITPRSNCVMDTSKLAAAGISMRPAEAAIEECLQNWTAP